MHATTLLAPAPADRRTRRVATLLTALVGYALGQALLLVAGLGVDPWDVLHQGLARTLGGQVGTWTLLASGVVLLLWIPLRQRPGVGTVANTLVIGPVLNVFLDLLPTPHALAARIAAMLLGIVLIAVATASYLGTGFGPGPRDGLMTGYAARGHSLRVVRTCIEIAVLAAGFCLGGNVGIGTLIFALSIGPMVHALLPVLRLGDPPRGRAPAPAQAAVGAGAD